MAILRAGSIARLYNCVLRIGLGTYTRKVKGTQELLVHHEWAFRLLMDKPYMVLDATRQINQIGK